MCVESTQVLRKMHRLKLKLSSVNIAEGRGVPCFSREGINKSFRKKTSVVFAGVWLGLSKSSLN